MGKTYQVKCPSCQQKLSIPEEYLGKKVACPGCKASLSIPTSLGSSQQPQERPIMPPGQGVPQQSQERPIMPPGQGVPQQPQERPLTSPVQGVPHAASPKTSAPSQTSPIQAAPVPARPIAQPISSNFTAPGNPTMNAPEPARPPVKQWYVHTDKGEEYGPINKKEIREWIEDGRVVEEDQVYCDGWDEWKLAPEAFPDLFPEEARNDPFAFGGASNSGGGHSIGYSGGSGYSSGGYSGPKRPHRGGLLMTTGILCFVCNPCAMMTIFTLLAANHDLEEMRRGRMDPSGMSQTKTAQTCAGVSVVLIVVTIFLVIVGNIILVSQQGRL